MNATRPDEPFDERVERLKQELALALQWDRPSILLAVYSSMFVRADAEAVLEVWLREQGQAVARVQVSGPDDPAADVPLALREWPERAHTVFFVSGLRQGAPTTWNALNVRREYLVDGRIRVVFWVTEGEAAELPQRAPDFWAFRHRVVEFVEPPEVGRVAYIAGELAWEGFEERLSPEEREARIAFREWLLSELPDVPETAAARAQLYYTLGGLYFFGREYEPALRHIQVALALSEQAGDATLQALALNGLGNVYRALGRYAEAIAAYERPIALDPKLAYPHNGLGNVYSDLGRYEEAIAAYEWAIVLDPKDAVPHLGLGNVYYQQGRHEEAIAAYQQAIELDPESAASHNNLGDRYLQLGQLEKAEAEFQERVRLSPDDALDAEVCLGVIAYHRGDKVTATNHFERALAIWNTAWQRCLQTSAALLQNRAQALLGLGRSQEALAILRQALDQWLPGDTIDFYVYDTLAAASEPPAGLEDVMALLWEAGGEEARRSTLSRVGGGGNRG